MRTGTRPRRSSSLIHHDADCIQPEDPTRADREARTPARRGGPADIIGHRERTADLPGHLQPRGLWSALRRPRIVQLRESGLPHLRRTGRGARSVGQRGDQAQPRYPDRTSPGQRRHRPGLDLRPDRPHLHDASKRHARPRRQQVRPVVRQGAQGGGASATRCSIGSRPNSARTRPPRTRRRTSRR